MPPRTLRFFVAAFLLTTFATSLSAQQNTAPDDQIYAQIPVWGESGEQKLQSGDIPGAIEDFKKAFEGSRDLRRQYPQEPAYSENAYYYLSRLANAFSRANNFPQAVQMADPAARGFAEMARNSPDNAAYKENATNAFGALAWYQILNKEPAAAEKSAREALQFTPDSMGANINLAHALLLTGKRAEAEAIYKAMRPLTGGDGRSMREVILEDFDVIEAAGISNPAIPELRQTLGGSKATGARRTGTKTKSDRAVWPFILGVALFIGAIFVLLLYLERKRTEKIEAAAKALGFTFRRKATVEDSTLVANSPLATLGTRGRQIWNVLEVPATDGVKMTLFDFSYSVGHGKQSRTHQQTVTRVQSSKLRLPGFDLRPESMFAKIAQTFGYKDIDIPGWPTFSKMYLLRGQDSAAIMQVFTPAVLQHCEQNKHTWISGNGEFLWHHRDSSLLKPDNITAFVERSRQVAALFLTGNNNPPAAPPPPLPPPPLPTA